MTNFVAGIISLTIGVVVMAHVFIVTVKGTNTTGAPVITGTNPVCTPGALVNCTLPGTWTGAETALWGLLSLIGIAGIIYGVMSVFGMA